MGAKHSIHIESDEFRTMITTSLDGFLIVAVTGHILDANDSYCRMMGYSREELVNMHISEIDAIESHEDVSTRSEEIVQRGALRFETRHRHKNGSIIDIEVCSNYSSAHGGIFFSTFRDITEHKHAREIINTRLRLMEFSVNHSMDELLQKTLDEAENLTGSCVGFYHFLDSDQEMLTLQAWSTRTATKFCKAEGSGSHYHLSQAGVWVDCVRERRAVIHNDYASLPHRKGMPEGHATVVRELVAPVFRNGKIVAILGIGNKATDYDQRDVDLVTLLADLTYGVVEHKQNDISLRQSEERYRNIVEYQTEFVDRYLPGGILTYVNESLVKFAGIPKEDLLGISFYPFVHEADREDTVRRIESISVDNPVVETESRIALPDGRLRWNRWTHTGFFDDKGTLIEYQSAGRDITERKTAEIALEESEERYRSLFKKAGEGICLLSLQGELIQVNEVFAQEHGYDIQEMLGMNIRDLDINGGVEENSDKVQALLSGKTITFEVEHCHRDGHVFPLEVKVSPISLDGESSFICFHRDISDRKKTEKALRESEHLFRALVASSSQSVWSFRPGGLSQIEQIDRANASWWCEYTGQSEAQRTADGGMGWLDAVYESDREKAKNNWQRIITSSEPASLEYRVHRRDGELRWLLVRGIPIEDNQGTITEIAGTVTDITELKKAELSLQKLSFEMERLLETSSTGLTRCSRDLHYLSANTAYAKLTGVPREQIIGKPIAGVMGEEGLAAIMPYVERVLNGERVEYETSVPFKSGGDRHLHVAYNPDKDENGDIIGWVASITDISERKHAEIVLKDKEYELEQAQLLAKTGSWTYDPVIQKSTWSKGMFQIWGLDPSRGLFPVEDHQKYIHPDDYPKFEAVLKEAVEHGAPYSMELRIKRPDGIEKTIITICEPLCDSTGKVVKLRGTNQDITESKKVEKELLAAKEFLELTQRSAGAGLWAWDFASGELSWSPEQYQLFGLDPSVGPPTFDLWRNVVHPDDLKLAESKIRDAIREHEQLFNEYRIITHSGEIRWINAIGQISYDNSGEPRRMSGICLDITNRKKDEEKKLIFEQQLQHSQKLESLGVLSGGIAHDFNNILAIIIGYCGLIKMNYETSEKNIPEIEKAAERAASLCRQMMSYAGKAQLTMTQVNMWATVDEMITLLKTTLPQNAEIKADLPTNLPYITADASQLRQIVMNLIINASEAIGNEQGEIRVSLDKVTVTAKESIVDYNGKVIPSGEYVCLEVADNGCGMDEETKWRVFEPFYTTKFTGRGLGMSAVLGIINSHNGALQLFSQRGKGTTFRVYLPVPKDDSVRNGKNSSEAPPVEWQGSGTVLLVDDEDQVRLIAKAFLEMFGFTVLEAVNGREALELFMKNSAKITLVVSDIGMPVMDGYKLFGELKNLSPKLPIIISSGFGDTDVTSRLGSDNVAGIISKPYNSNQLRDVLKRAVGG